MLSLDRVPPRSCNAVIDKDRKERRVGEFVVEKGDL